MGRKFSALYNKNRRIVFSKEDICYICGNPVDKTLPHSSMFSAQVDHVFPRSKGGSDELFNLRLAHRYCNEVLKGTKTVAQLQTDLYSKIMKEKMEKDDETGIQWLPVEHNNENDNEDIDDE